jgi:hypothetical protein
MAAISPNQRRQQNQNPRKPETTVNPSSGPWLPATALNPG